MEHKLEPLVEENTVAVLYERFLREFMDVLIMVKIREEGEASGYDVLSYIHRGFGLLVSPGTVYAMLYSMEREGLIKPRGGGKKRIYNLTPKGVSTIQAINDSSNDIERFLSGLLKSR